jgi:uncharacterized damage-inducible protein DinB
VDDAATLSAKLKSDAERLIARLAALDENGRSAKVYVDGTVWTARDVVAHLVSAERAFLALFRDIQDGGDGVSQDFVIDEFNAREHAKYEEMEWAELLTMFERTRGRMCAMVQAFTIEDLEKRGRHPYLGMTSLREMVKMVYIHSQTHSRDVRKTLGIG